MVGWYYGAVALSGNLHDVARYLQKYGQHAEVLAVSSAGAYTVILYREPKDTNLVDRMEQNRERRG